MTLIYKLDLNMVKLNRLTNHLYVKGYIFIFIHQKW